MKKENKSTVNKSTVHIAVMTKGGVGKTTFVETLSASLYLNNPKKQINIFELDDNNVTRVNSNYLNHQSFKLKDGEIVVDDIQFSILCDNNVNTIVDCGGGNNSKQAIQMLKDIDLFGLNYYIPLTDNMNEILNTQDTINLIRDFDKSATINLVLNRCLSLDKLEIQKQFINVFGEPLLDIPNQLDNLKVDNVFFVPNSNIFSILKSHYKVSLLDSYLSAIDLVQNIETYRQEWIKEDKDKEEYRKILKESNVKYRFSKMVIELMDKLEPIRKAL